LNVDQDIELHDKVAYEYDDLAKKYNGHIHGAFFGMCYEYIKPDDQEFASAWDTTIYKHSDKYIKNIVQNLNFTIQKELKIISGSDDEETESTMFKIFILQKRLKS